MEELRFRQVHLDFHTSEHIPDVGSRFDPEQFVAALQAGRVNSVTCFARGHHGWCTYPTKVGRMHPTLSFDLLGEQIAACHAAGINVPVYITVGWDELSAREHPEWLEVSPEGTPHGAPPLKAGWRKLCFNTPYLDYVIAITEEVLRGYGGDGVFLDIIHQGPCCCPTCLHDMEEGGLDARDPADRQAFGRQVLRRYTQRMTEAVHAIRPDHPIFHNSGHIPRGQRELFPYFTHFELESLPTGGWGYDHFPLSARYVATTGKDFLGMTGKFHTTWGEFGGYKNPVALQAECAAMIAFGAKCSVGDQLHPDGHMDEDTCRIIGQAYAHVEAREAWCRGARPVSEAAILSVEAVGQRARGNDDPDVGAARLLLEKHVPFDVVDTTAELSRYRLLILPDEVPLDEAELLGKVQGFVDGGGTLVLSGRSGMNAEGTEFLVDLGAVPEGPSPWCPDYVKAGEAIGGGLVAEPFVMGERAEQVRVLEAEVLAEAWRPYFNREFRHFCSHQHAPPAGPAGYPAVIRRGSVLYFAHPVFTTYRARGAQLVRDTVWNAITRVHGRPAVEVSLPSGGRVSLMRQDAEGRHVLHLLYAPPIARGRGIEVIEDVVPLFDVAVSLRVQARRVTLVPEGEELPFAEVDDRIEFSVPRLELHQMIVLED